MNTSIFIVKIISQPIQSFFIGDISIVELIVEFPKVKKKKSFQDIRLSIWGDLGGDICKYYQIGDYVIVEGFLSLRTNISNSSLDTESEFTVIKFYPFLLAE